VSGVNYSFRSVFLIVARHMGFQSQSSDGFQIAPILLRQPDGGFGPGRIQTSCRYFPPPTCPCPHPIQNLDWTTIKGWESEIGAFAGPVGDVASDGTRQPLAPVSAWAGLAEQW